MSDNSEKLKAEFKAWWQSKYHRLTSNMQEIGLDAWSARQPEIDSLMARIHALNVKLSAAAVNSAQSVALPAPAENWGNTDMAAAPRDSTMLRLYVRFDENATDDLPEGACAATIGFNNFDNDGDDTWHIAGWCWSHDHFTEGKGTPVAWLPMLSEAGRGVVLPDKRSYAGLKRGHEESFAIGWNNCLCEVAALNTTITAAELEALRSLVLNAVDNFNDLPVNADWAERWVEKAMALFPKLKAAMTGQATAGG